MKKEVKNFVKGSLSGMLAGAVLLGAMHYSQAKESAPERNEVVSNSPSVEVSDTSRAYDPVALEERSNLNGTRYSLPSDEVSMIKKHAKRVGVDPEILMALRLTENGGPGREFGILPQGNAKERYDSDKGYNFDNDGDGEKEFNRYSNSFEKQLSWAAWTVKRNEGRFSQNPEGHSDLISYLSENYAPGEVHWERNMRKIYNSLEGKVESPERKVNSTENISQKVEKREEAKSLPVKLPEGFEAPKFPGNWNADCAKYVRVSLDHLYGKSMNRGDAWNLRHLNTRVAPYNSQGLDLDKLENEGTLKPGMIVGIEWPKSRYATRKDLKGETAKYTHVAMYVGEGKDGKPYVVHNFGKGIYLDSQEKLKSRGLKVVEVLKGN